MFFSGKVFHKGDISDSLDKFAIQLNDVLALDSMLEIEVASKRVLVFLD